MHRLVGVRFLTFGVVTPIESHWPHFTKHYPDCWSICGPNSVGRRYRLGVKEVIIPNHTDSLTPKDLDENSNGK
jgi:hypothetical protein